jgi:4-carboxymuconolactone decarboxylase
MPNRDDPAKIPGVFKEFVARFPELADTHQKIGEVVDKMGPLESRQCELIKIGICVGAGLESALRSHVRRALQAGATREEIEQAIMLGMNTVGFPRTVAAWSWARVQFQRDEKN